MAEKSQTDVTPISYEDLALIEDEFEEVDTEIMRKQYELSIPLYAKRASTVSQIPSFWPLVLEQAPPEIDQWIQQQDSRIFAESLLSMEVRRPEVDGDKKSGNPRSLSIKLSFRPNDDFEDAVLEKHFWYRRAKDGWTGLVSEPVKIHWKKGKDLTEGLTDGACALFEARKALGDMTAKGLPEYTALKKKVENWNGMNTSFFTWFGWVSGRRWVGVEESEEAVEKYRAFKEKRRAGQKVENPEEAEEADEGDLEDEHDDEAVEVHQAGDELAISFADDVWPNALKFFTAAQEADDISDVEFEDDDMDDLDDEDADGGDEPVDIRALVGDRKGRARDSAGGAGPPSKKQKK